MLKLNKRLFVRNSFVTLSRDIIPTNLLMTVLLILMGGGLACAERSEAVEIEGQQLKLPKSLREISGLASLPDGSLLAHGDERGSILRLNFQDSQVEGYAKLGQPTLKGDFEGIAVLGDRLYLLASNGNLFERDLASSSMAAEYTKHATGLKSACDFEGLATSFGIAAGLPRLALLCKQPKKKGERDQLVIYFWSPATQMVDHSATLRIEPEDIGATLHPSGIEWLENVSKFVIVAAKERKLLVLTETGEVVALQSLPNRVRHPQTEGIAILNGWLYLADEANPKQTGHNKGTVIRYRLDNLEDLTSALSKR